MHYLSLGAIFRMENSWLEEWIRYHFAVGVEHIILYNDDDDTHVSDRILQPYVDRGVVENIHVRNHSKIRDDINYRQNDAYRDMIESMVGQTRWLAILDLDELVLPRQSDDVRECLEGYEDHSALAVNWTIFGSGGHIKRPPSQINDLLRRSETNWHPNRFVKSIVKPDRVRMDEQHHTHYFPTRDGETVNENHDPVRWISHDIATEKIRINHYVVRSLQDFWEVKVPRPRLGNNPVCDEAYFEYHDRNDVFDDEISRRFGHVVNQ